MIVIDLDSHSAPRAQDYAIEPEYAHLRPRLEVTYEDGRRVEVESFNDRVMRRISSSRILTDEEKAKLDRKRSAYHDSSVRHEEVTKAGINFQFISCGVINTFNYVEAGTGAAFWRAYNNFLYNNFMKPYPKTFSGLPQLPLQDLPEAMKELERCVKGLGMTAFLMPSNWNGIDMADPHWWGFWDRVRELGITGIINHAGTLHDQWVGKERLAVLGPDGTNARHILSHPFEYCTNIVNLIFGGMMDRFPEFKFAFLEVGAEFAITLKHRIGENMEQIDHLQEMVTHPLEWYFDRFYFLVDDILLEGDGRRLENAIEELGEDHLFFGSDYPHFDSQLEMAARIKGMGGLSSSAKEKILGENVLVWKGGRRP